MKLTRARLSHQLHVDEQLAGVWPHLGGVAVSNVDDAVVSGVCAHSERVQIW
jgi:hypothetical protein